MKHVPDCLKAVRQWVLWKTLTRNGEATKVPVQVGGHMAKSNDPGTWTTYHEALDASLTKQVSGLGFMFTEADEFCGIDFDGCRDPETGTVATWARDWIVKFASYAEVSPSKTGVKIFIRAKSPFDSGRKRNVEADKITDKTPGVEVYDRLRYFAVTGLKLSGMPSECEPRQEVLDEFCKTFFPPERTADTPRSQRNDVSDRAAKYLDRLPPAISGQGGHNATFHAACVLVLGFGMSPQDAYPLLSEFNQRCNPPWSERELMHKLHSAEKQPGERNYLRDARPDQWDQITVPNYAPSNPRQPVVDTTPVVDGLTLQGAATKYLESLASGQNTLIELGIAELDYAIGGGVAAGEVVILAARPSHGKSAVALQILDNCARDGMPGLIISEEMSTLAIGKRVLQYVSDEAEEHWRTSRDAVAKTLEWHYDPDRRKPVYIAENCRTAAKACATVEWYIKERGVKVAVIDYAQILGSSGKTPYEKVTATSIELRNLANRTGIILIVLCQLSRSIESREKFIPKGSDLKESGQLEQDADVIAFLVWPHRVNSSKDPKQYQIFISKNRNRAINQSAIDCEFLPSRQMVRSEPAKNRSPEFDAWNNGSKDAEDKEF